MRSYCWSVAANKSCLLSVCRRRSSVSEMVFNGTNNCPFCCCMWNTVIHLAENKKPAADTPIVGKDVTICKYPSNPSILLGYLSVCFSFSHQVLATIPCFILTNRRLSQRLLSLETPHSFCSSTLLWLE